tara:strand:- start:138 stop:467 length:330 start_codon:yes stop_codon:yes gene_type:complete
MVNIIELDLYRERLAAAQKVNCKARSRTADKFIKAQAFEKLTLEIDNMLEDKARDRAMPDAVAMAAGHYAAIRLFQKYGRAQTLAFFEDCIQTAEICDEILAQLDDELV